MTVTKMSDPTQVRTYTNAVNQIPITAADTDAFLCP